MVGRKKFNSGSGKVTPTSSFLGALRSELDDSSELHESFQMLESSVASVRAAFTSFRISPEKAGALFALLRLKDAGENEWTMGASSGEWYCRHKGMKEWMHSEPPIGIEPEADEPDWVYEGLGAYLMAETSDGPHEEDATLMPKPLQEAKQQAKAQSDAITAGEPIPHSISAPSRSRTMDENASWLLEEWTTEKAAVAAPRTVDPVSVDMPEVSPERWQEDKAIADALDADNVKPPVERDQDPFTSPEDYFLPPESE